jgi:hypothetical protein
MLDRDIPFSARKSARSKKKESPASFCIESHAFSLLFKKAQITFRQRQWWDLSNVASFVHFGCRNPKFWRAETLNAWPLVTSQLSVEMNGLLLVRRRWRAGPAIASSHCNWTRFKSESVRSIE